MGMSSEPPLARTNAETHVFLRLQACSSCGETDCRFRSSVVRVGDALCSRYTGTCPRCGNQRIFDFRLPEEIEMPPADGVSYGGDAPSVLLDAGQWLSHADDRARRVPANRVGLDQAEQRAARHALASAVAALDEVLKFLPEGADRVPESAFFTEQGRAVFAREPGRFSKARLEAVRDAYLGLRQ
jgi:hypothetical protein